MDSNLKQMRIRSGITQRELATRVGVTPPAVAMLERGGIRDTRTAAKYAKALNCNPIFLLEGITNG